MSDTRPLISWKAVAAMRNEAPIHEVALPVFKSAETDGMDVETLVWSIKETKRARDRAGNATKRRLFGITFR